MAPALPTPRYAKRLAGAFPDVRLRWSEQNHEWLLEAKTSRLHVHLVDPDRYPVEAMDTFIRHRDGYFLLRPFAPDELPSCTLLIRGLETGERVRQRYEAQDLANALDERDAATTEQKRQKRREKCRELGSELYDARWTSHRPSELHHG